MDTRVAVISIIVENPAAIEELNHYLHEAGEYIIGRMGIPYREKGINIISIAIDNKLPCLVKQMIQRLDRFRILHNNRNNCHSCIHRFPHFFMLYVCFVFHA